MVYLVRVHCCLNYALSHGTSLLKAREAEPGLLAICFSPVSEVRISFGALILVYISRKFQSI